MSGNAAHLKLSCSFGHYYLQQKDLVGISHTDPATASEAEMMELPSPKALSSRPSVVFRGQEGSEWQR